MRIIIFLLAAFATSTVFGTELEHPHLLFTTAELPALREKIAKNPIPARALRNLRSRCDAVLKTGKFPKSKFYPLDANRFDPLTELLFAWHFTGETRYRDGFLKHFRKLAAEKFDFTNYDPPLLYDLGFPLLNAAERNTLRDALKRMEQFKPLAEDWSFYSNWALCRDSVPHFAVAARWGADDFDRKRIDLYAAELRAFFQCFIGPRGYPEEGWIYFDYGLNVRGALMLEALRRKGFDFVQNTALARIPEAMLITATPDPKFQKIKMLPLGDSLPAWNSIYGINLLARLLPGHPLIPFLLRDAQRDDTHNFGVAGGILLFPFDTPPAKAGEPYPETAPNSAFFESEKLFVYRDRRSDDALFVALRGGAGGGHQHGDAGAPVLWADGVEYLIDPGYGKYDAGGHNTLLIDRRGSGERGGSAAIVRSYLIAPGGAFLDLDLAPCWNERNSNWRWRSATPVRFHRRALTVIAADAANRVPGYVMVFDRARKDDEPHDFRQVFQLGPKMNVALERGAARIVDPEHADRSLRIIPLGPDGVKTETVRHRDYGRFPKPWQRLDLTDTRVDASFATLLLPLKGDAKPPKITRLENFNLRVRFDWEHATDYWGWADPDRLETDGNTARFLFLRVPKNMPPTGSKLLACGIFDAADVNLAMGRDNWVRSFESSAPDRKFYENVGTRGNFLWRDGELHARIFTPQEALWPIQRRSCYEVLAPKLTRLVVNGRTTPFQSNGDRVKFTARSTVPCRIDEERAVRHQTIYNEFCDIAEKMQK